MAWNAALPADSTPLRLGPTYIRANWDAIVDATSGFKPVGLNLNNRTPLAVSNNPTAISDALILFSKEDSSGSPQLFAIDEGSNVYQLTKVPISSTSPAYGTNYSAQYGDGFYVSYGRISWSGASQAVTFATAFPNNLLSLSLTPVGAAANISAWNVQSPSTTGFTAVGSNTGSAFYYMAIGN